MDLDQQRTVFDLELSRIRERSADMVAETVERGSIIDRIVNGAATDEEIKWFTDRVAAQVAHDIG